MSDQAVSLLVDAILSKFGAQAVNVYVNTDPVHTIHQSQGKVGSQRLEGDLP